MKERGTLKSSRRNWWEIRILRGEDKGLRDVDAGLNTKW